VCGAAGVNINGASISFAGNASEIPTGAVYVASFDTTALTTFDFVHREIHEAMGVQVNSEMPKMWTSL
jgi:hypothetical protein